MVFIDWYVLLAVEPSANENVIRRAYRRAALKYHPDKNPDSSAVEQFDLLGQALVVLTDVTKRAEFDSTRARRVADSRSKASQSDRIKELKAKLDAPTPPSVDLLQSDLELLRQESYEHRKALDALRNEQSLSSSSVSYRTLADNSRTFDTIAEARAFVDANAGARLKASWRPSTYTKEYEEATLDRLSKVLN